MSKHAMVDADSGEQAPRERLGPVAGAIIVLYVVIMTGGYFLGNMIYQIP